MVTAMIIFVIFTASHQLITHTSPVRAAGEAAEAALAPLTGMNIGALGGASVFTRGCARN